MLLLKIKFFRFLLTITRLIYFRIFSNFEFAKYNNKYIKKGTAERNYNSVISFRDCYSGERSRFFLKNINTIFDNKRKKKILLVGPRNEGEIFNFMASGFHSENIDAIDLVSYSRKIKILDMHSIDKLKKKYDLIYFGFVLNYSKNINKVIYRAKKILKKSGYIGIANEYEFFSTNSKKKKIYLSRMKNTGYDFLEPLTEKYFLNKKTLMGFKKIFFKTYLEKLGIFFDIRKCMTILLKKK